MLVPAQGGDKNERPPCSYCQKQGHNWRVCFSRINDEKRAAGGQVGGGNGGMNNGPKQLYTREQIEEQLQREREDAIVKMPDGALMRQAKGIPMGDPLSPGMTTPVVSMVVIPLVRFVLSANAEVAVSTVRSLQTDRPAITQAVVAEPPGVT